MFNGGVVMAGYFEGTGGEFAALNQCGAGTLLVQHVEQIAVFGLVGNDDYILEVLCSSADERDAAYVDLLDRVFLRSTAGSKG